MWAGGESLPELHYPSTAEIYSPKPVLFPMATNGEFHFVIEHKRHLADFSFSMRIGTCATARTFMSFLPFPAAKFRTLPECAGKIGLVASGRFMIFYRFSTKQVDPRIGPEVTVGGCLGVFITDYNPIWNLPEPFRTQIRKTAEKK